jgi:Fe-S oxidoreductase/nitrate reductase gamma subunit
MPHSEEVTRIIFGNVPRWMAISLYVGALLSCGWAALLIAVRARQYVRARRLSADDRQQRSLQRGLMSLLTYLAGHRELRRDRYAGTAHWLTFAGYLILFIGTCLVLVEHDTPLHFFYGRFYLISSLVIDLGGVAFLIGLAMFLARRLGRWEPRIERPGRGGDVLTLTCLLLAIGITGFLLEAARIAIDVPAFERWSVVGYSLAVPLRAAGVSAERAAVLHRWLWAGHAVLCLAFFAFLPWGFFGHMVYGPATIVLRSRKPRAELRPVSRTAGHVLTELIVGDGRPGNRAAAAPGASVPSEMPWIDLLQADACTSCGRCNAVCPAAAAGKPLQPREIVLGIRDAIASDRRLMNFIADDALWSCTTCGACNEACPVGIEVYDKIVELRRGRVDSGTIPEQAEAVFEQSASRFNPFGRSNDERLAWSRGLDVPVAAPGEKVEVLYWVGCGGSFDPDGQSVARAMIGILNKLGVNYKVLGTRERCTGDPARRMGEEGLFQELAEYNLARFDEHAVRRVITHCPHCYNTLRNEYQHVAAVPANADGDRQSSQKERIDVEHHTQLIARMIGEGRLRLQHSAREAVTFHDPCYLGRGNGEVAAPRDVLAGLPGVELTEMPRSGRNSFCCGAGGGSMWLDVRGVTRIESQRYREAATTGAATIATACPFCKTMLTSATSDGPRLRVRDIAEMVAEAEGITL